MSPQEQARGAALYAAERKQRDGELCLQRFNPLFPEIFDSTTELWTELLINLVDRVSLQRLKATEAPEVQGASVARGCAGRP